jgi:Fur family peroxide stress response transcriptional regulator
MMEQPYQTKITYLLNQLEAAGKRSTPQRYAVCQALVEHGEHPTVAEVFERVRGTFPMISQATVYNTIDTLTELGLIHKLEIANDEHTHYDLDLTPHINMVCPRCGRITDVHNETVDTLLGEVQHSSGHRLCRPFALVLYGVCPECQAHCDGHCMDSGSMADCPHIQARMSHHHPVKHPHGPRQRRRRRQRGE